MSGSAGFKMPIHAQFFWRAILIRKVCQTDLAFGMRHGSLVGLSMQDYKSLCAAVAICSTLVKI